VTGELRLAQGNGGAARCVHCGAEAVGPCASCEAPLCGDCCIITHGGAKPWAICRDCAATETSLARRWASVIAWVMAPIAILVLLLLILGWLTR
jgi:hypothetical protein